MTPHLSHALALCGVLCLAGAGLLWSPLALGLAAGLCVGAWCAGVLAMGGGRGAT